MNKDLIELAEIFVKNRFGNDTTGHDWFHTDRVRKIALHIAFEEQRGHVPTIELAALLHDIPDRKLNESEGDGWRILNDWFLHSKIEKQTINEVTAIIDSISYSKGQSRLPSIEAKIVQDADRLDAIGAIGIARTFAYGGSVGNPIHHPDLDTIEAKQSTIQHFYDKLLKIADQLHTNTAKELAKKRNQYMQEFLQQFYIEWDVQI
ncbi:HD domain-containing protein [Peribacillus sp. JNUCC 23]|uniref:HD domain-containing protein n=1 Tax=Peribacillus sp. NPDC096379 TaxID=3364393 RepID=UPI0007840654